MRCLFLFMGPARPSHRVIPEHEAPSYSVGVPSSVSLPRPRLPKSLFNNGVSTSQRQAGELGHTLLATLQSNPIVPIPKSQQQRKKEGEEEAQISGSDVLWALQRASAHKNKKKKKKKKTQEQRRVSSSVGTPREESAGDHTNVRPLCINPNWAAKLDELDKRLRELSDAT